MEDAKIYEQKAEKIKALAHPHRLCIVKGLINKNAMLQKYKNV